MNGRSAQSDGPIGPPRHASKESWSWDANPADRRVVGNRLKALRPAGRHVDEVFPEWRRRDLNPRTS